jgi:IS4 transposase
MWPAIFQRNLATRLVVARPSGDATHFLAGRRIAEWSGSGGIKLHMMYELGSERPVCFAVTPKGINDITAAQAMPVEAGATYVFDKGYYHFAFWAKINAAGARFVTRLKINSPIRVSSKLKVEAGGNILFDRVGHLNERLMSARSNPYAMPVRVIGVRLDNSRSITLVSNDLDSPAQDIASLYKRRWQIELFFKWIKQNLKLGHFLGISRNAAIIQIMAALIAYMLMRIATLKANAELGLQATARLIQAMLLSRRNINDVFKPPPKPQTTTHNQLSLWTSRA